MVGRLLSFWDGKIFRGYVKHRECMIKALKSINCPWGLKDFCFGGPFAFSGDFLLLSGCTILEGSGNDGVIIPHASAKCRGFTNWYLIFLKPQFGEDYNGKLTSIFLSWLNHLVFTIDIEPLGMMFESVGSKYNFLELDTSTPSKLQDFNPLERGNTICITTTWEYLVPVF